MEDRRPQEVLAGKYRLVRPLGKGGMGQVWLADHLSLRCSVAVKLIDPKIANDVDYRARFLREARAAAALRSPHVVQILDHGVEGDTPYIVMELLEGESLAQRLLRFGQLAPAETARVLTQVGRAITRAHDGGVVHRDLKPDNVFLVANDEEELAKVVDFGIAKATVTEPDAPVSVNTDAGKVLGTCYYMSPEQAAGSKTVDHRTDIWSMGVIAFECLLGRRPFQGETLGGFFQAIYGKPLPVPSQLGAVPAGFDEWFARACAHDLEARFPTAREACAELRRVCEVPPSPPSGSSDRRPVPSPPRDSAATDVARSSGAMMASELVSRAPRRGRGVSVALAAVAASALGLGIIVWRRQAPVSHATPPEAQSSPAAAAILAAPPPDPATPSSPPAATPSSSRATVPSRAVEVPPVAAAPPSTATATGDSTTPTRHGPASDHRRRVRRVSRSTAPLPEPVEAVRAAPRIDLGL